MDEDAKNLGRCFEPHRHLFDPQVRWQAAVGAQGQVQLIKFLSSDKRGVELHGQLVELAIQTVLHDVALATAGEERNDLAVLELINIHCFIDLR